MTTTAQSETAPAYRFAAVITLAFVVVAGFGVYNHEMWRDELEIFMEMRDAPGFFSLFPDIQPLPNLYLSLLYAIVKLWPDTAIFQIFHLLVITATVFLFNGYSPFTRLQKILFTFSYFVLYEYGIISREYSMLMLFVFLLVYLVTRKKQNFIMIALAIVILANHHLYGVFVSVSIFIYEVLYLAPRVKALAPEEKKSLRIAGLLLALACFYVLPQYLLLLKWNRYAGTFGQAPFFMTIRSIWNAFLPVPYTADMDFWGTNILPFPQMFSKTAVASEFITVGNILAASVSLLILFMSITIFSRKISVLIVFLINTAMQLMFLQHLSVFYIRYQGPLLIIFIYNYWLLSHSDERPDLHVFDRIADFFAKPFFVSLRKFASPFVTFILFVQFCTGIFSYIQDVRYPFTASYETAKYIKEQRLNDTSVMVGYMDYAVQTISGHLNQKIFYPQKGDFGTHMVWRDRNRRDTMPLNEVLDRAIEIHYETGKNVLLILNVPVRDALKQNVDYLPLYNGSSLSFLKGFTKSIVPDEQFFLYLIARDQS